MTNNQYNLNDRIGSAADCIDEMKDAKSFVMIPMPLLMLLQEKQLSLQAFALYTGLIYPRANLQKNYNAKFRMKDLVAFTRKSVSTIRNYLVELETAGLIARGYWTHGQKTILIGCELTFFDSDSESMIRDTANRSDAGSNKRSSLWPSPNNKRSPQPDNSRLITTVKTSINNNNKQIVSFDDCSAKNTFEPFDLARINKSLSDLNISDPKGLLNEMAFSFTHGKWKIPAKGKVNAMLKLIRSGKWRTPAGMDKYNS